MTDPKDNAAEAAPVNAQTVQGSNEANVDLTMAEGKAATPPEGPTAETLGVNEQQFEKYFDAKTGQYNWQAHAKELEFAAQQKPKAEADSKADAETKDAATATDAEAQKAAEAAGLDWQALGVKILNDGDIEAADYEALEKSGVPKEIVKEYISLMTDSAERHVNEVLESFGGEEQFNKVREWAQKNMSSEELATLEHQLADKTAYKSAVETLMTKAGATGVVNTPMRTGTTGAVEGFKTQAEMVAAMRDPRYRRDAAYRTSVEAKVAASKWDVNPRQHVG